MESTPPIQQLTANCSLHPWTVREFFSLAKIKQLHYCSRSRKLASKRVASWAVALLSEGFYWTAVQLEAKTINISDSLLCKLLLWLPMIHGTILTQNHTLAPLPGHTWSRSPKSAAVMAQRLHSPNHHCHWGKRWGIWMEHLSPF